MTRTKEQLIIENEKLHSRLVETEEFSMQSETERWMRLWFPVQMENKSILSVLLKRHIGPLLRRWAKALSHFQRRA